MDFGEMKALAEKDFSEGYELREFTWVLNAERIVLAAVEIANALRNGKKVLLCGNGGSAADAQHIAAELLGKFLKTRKALPAISLSTNTSVITAVGNDFNFEEIFARQVEGLGAAGDVLICISTSGNSPNVIKAAQKGKEKELKIISLTGKGGGKLGEVTDILIEVPSTSTPRIQEMHIVVGHVVCHLVEEMLSQ